MKKVFDDRVEYYNSVGLHRDDGPACEYGDGDGDKQWWINGKLHRTDGPAIEYANGTKYWYINGKRHRPDGPAIKYANGDKHWYINGKLLASMVSGKVTICTEGEIPPLIKQSIAMEALKV